jgi:Clp amino terminal domain, pathogenicity island component
MFDLEKSIHEWRQRMLGAGVKSEAILFELESHLRDDIEQQMRTGLSSQQAFEIAVERIGGAHQLKGEFAKVNRLGSGILRKVKEFILGRSAGKLSPSIAFAPAAQQTLEFARAEAPLLNHDFIGTEHVLLGLLKSQSGIVSNVMRRLGVEFDSIRAEIEKVIGPGMPAQSVAANSPYTPRATRALTLAAKEAQDLNQTQVSPEHIFLGLVREGEGVAAIVLKNLGVDISRARGEIVKEMNLRKSAG